MESRRCARCLNRAIAAHNRAKYRCPNCGAAFGRGPPYFQFAAIHAGGTALTSASPLATAATSGR
jgi:hypothetical protein